MSNKKLIINISVDWEGESLSNLGYFRQWRRKYFPDIPINHFICPSYFLRTIDKQKFNGIILPIDEIGIDLHPRKELVKYFNIPFRISNNYYRVLPQYYPQWLKTVLTSGRGVPLTVYNSIELKTIIAGAKQITENYFNCNIQGFRAGGWLINETVYKILEQEGFKYDSSAVPPQVFSFGYNEVDNGNYKDNFGDKNGVFTRQVIDTWGNKTINTGYLANGYMKQFYTGAINIFTQPYKIGIILEIPNNGAMSDFATFELTHNKQLEYFKNQNTDFVLSVGCHMEGPNIYKEYLADTIQKIKQSGVNYEFRLMKYLI